MQQRAMKRTSDDCSMGRFGRRRLSVGVRLLYDRRQRVIPEQQRDERRQRQHHRRYRDPHFSGSVRARHDQRRGEGVWPKALWDALEESGLPLTWVPEELGGAGAALADGFAVLRVAGRYAAPVPLAETLMAGW